MSGKQTSGEMAPMARPLKKALLKFCFIFPGFKSLDVCVGRKIEMGRDNAHVALFQGMEIGIWSLIEVCKFAAQPKICAAILILTSFKAISPIGMCLLCNLDSFDSC